MLETDLPHCLDSVCLHFSEDKAGDLLHSESPPFLNFPGDNYIQALFWVHGTNNIRNKKNNLIHLLVTIIL